MTSRKEKTVEISIPMELYFTIIRLQGIEELDFFEACKRAAALIEGEGEKFHRRVKVEANRLYKSRFMRELNTARKTWRMKRCEEGLEAGNTACAESGSRNTKRAIGGDGDD